MLKRWLWWVIFGLGLMSFVAFTLVMKKVDVQNLGPENAVVGLATFNQWCLEHLGRQRGWQMVADISGVITLLFALVVVLMFLGQWWQKKSLWRVDFRLWAVVITYVCLIVIYLLFEIIVINYRPVLVDGSLHAAYPSSHTMLFITVLGLTLKDVCYYLRHRSWRIGARIVLGALLIISVVARLLSGMHWATDIIGGVLVGGTLISLNFALTARI